METGRETRERVRHRAVQAEEHANPPDSDPEEPDPGAFGAKQTQDPEEQE